MHGHRFAARERLVDGRHALVELRLGRRVVARDGQVQRSRAELGKQISRVRLFVEVDEQAHAAAAQLAAACTPAVGSTHAASWPSMSQQKELASKRRQAYPRQAIHWKLRAALLVHTCHRSSADCDPVWKAGLSAELLDFARDLAPLSRRGFLRILSVGATLAVLSEACSPTSPNAPNGSASTSTTTSAPGSAGAAASAALMLPTYVPAQGPPPDVHRQPGRPRSARILNYPRTPNKTVQQPVGSGEEITAVTYTTQAPPTPAEQNPAWQRVNQELGVKVNLPLTQLADYPTKLNTIIAGGALPDLLSLGAGNGQSIANLPDFLQSQCTDLTPLVAASGEGYPTLANLPAVRVANAVFNTTSETRNDFLKAMQQLTVGGSQWGIGATSGAAHQTASGHRDYFLESFGAPNIWREANGKLTKDWEADEFKAAHRLRAAVVGRGCRAPGRADRHRQSGRAELLRGQVRAVVQRLDHRRHGLESRQRAGPERSACGRCRHFQPSRPPNRSTTWGRAQTC